METTTCNDDDSWNGIAWCGVQLKTTSAIQSELAGLGVALILGLYACGRLRNCDIVLDELCAECEALKVIEIAQRAIGA